MVSLDIRAYIDDSESVGSYSVLAGYIAPYDAWVKFNADWRRALARDGLTEFKSRNCDSGEGEFRIYKARPGYRREICERFVSLICRHRLGGAAFAIDLEAYDAHRPRIYDLRSGKLGKLAAEPYYVAMQYMLDALVEEPCRGLPPEEKVQVTFDSKPGFIGKTGDLYHSLAHSDRPVAARLHDQFGFADSASIPGIQAADLLAYEVKKRFEALRSGESPRWQYERLKGYKRLTLYLQRAEQIDRMMEYMEQQWGDAPSPVSQFDDT